MFLRLTLFLSITLFYSCSQEICTINLENNKTIYHKAIQKIYAENFEMNSSHQGWDLIKTFKKKDTLLDPKIFNDVQLIELHRDSTIIFQAYNCDEQTALMDEIFILVHSPKGILHIKKKRNIRRLKHIEGNWHEGIHVKTLAN